VDLGQERSTFGVANRSRLATPRQPRWQSIFDWLHNLPADVLAWFRLHADIDCSEREMAVSSANTADASRPVRSVLQADRRRTAEEVLRDLGYIAYSIGTKK
jgi:hypothetical protein